MWLVFKVDKKRIETLKKEFKLKLGEETIFYSPKLLIEKYNKNKLSSKEISLLGDYMFCYNKKFINNNILNILKFSKGLKYFLNGYEKSQNEIYSFIEKCKSCEDKKGYIGIDFFSLIKNSKYKFSNGPFTGKIFEIINLQKNKIDILLGQIKTSIKKEQFLFSPV